MGVTRTTVDSCLRRAHNIPGGTIVDKGLTVATSDKWIHSDRSRTQKKCTFIPFPEPNLSCNSSTAVASETSPLPPTALCASTYELSLRQQALFLSNRNSKPGFHVGGLTPGKGVASKPKNCRDWPTWGIFVLLWAEPRLRPRLMKCSPNLGRVGRERRPDA